MVEQRVVLANELKSLLKVYFPAILLLNPAKIYAEFIVRLLRKYPTLQAVQTAGRTKLCKFFFGVGAKEKVEQRLDALLDAVALSTDDVLLRTGARRGMPGMPTNLWGASPRDENENLREGGIPNVIP